MTYDIEKAAREYGEFISSEEGCCEGPAWCGDCRQSMSDFKAGARQFRDALVERLERLDHHDNCIIMTQDGCDDVCPRHPGNIAAALREGRMP